MDKTYLIVKKIGWSKSFDTNWSYRYYDITIISDNLNLLNLQGIYADTFGSIENYFSKLRNIKNVSVIIDNSLPDLKLPQRKMLKMAAKKDFKTIYDLLIN